jgi:hypothetical protein
MSSIATNSVEWSYNDVACLTFILWAYSLMLLRESRSCIWLWMSGVLSARKLRNTYPLVPLIYSWYPATYVDFIAFCSNHCCKFLIILLGHLALGKTKSACPKAKNYNHLEMSWHFSPNTNKNHLITLTLPLDIHSNTIVLSFSIYQQ